MHVCALRAHTRTDTYFKSLLFSGTLRHDSEQGREKPLNSHFVSPPQSSPKPAALASKALGRGSSSGVSAAVLSSTEPPLSHTVLRTRKYRLDTPGAEEGEIENSGHSSSAPHPFQSVGLLPRRPAFQVGRKEGLHAERRARTHRRDPCPAQRAQREKGPRGCAPGPRPPSYIPGCFGAAPVVLGFSFRCPGTSLGRRLPVWASGPGRLFLSTVRVFRTAARAAGHPQPAPEGQGASLLPEPPARQGRNPGSRWARVQQPPVP